MAELSPVTVKVRADTSEFMADIRGAIAEEVSRQVDAKLAEYERQLAALRGLLTGNSG